MEKLLARWADLCASSKTLWFVDINLRGVAQVLFQNNPLSGALFLAAISWGSYQAGVPQVAIAGVVAVVVATLTAQWLHTDNHPDIFRCMGIERLRRREKPVASRGADRPLS
jgi:urea transporter